MLKVLKCWKSLKVRYSEKWKVSIMRLKLSIIIRLLVKVSFYTSILIWEIRFRVETWPIYEFWGKIMVFTFISHHERDFIFYKTLIDPIHCYLFYKDVISVISLKSAVDVPTCFVCWMVSITVCRTLIYLHFCWIRLLEYISSFQSTKHEKVNQFVAEIENGCSDKKYAKSKRWAPA